MLSGNPFGLPAQRSRRLTESSPTGLSSNTRLAQLRQHVRQAPATLCGSLKDDTKPKKQLCQPPDLDQRRRKFFRDNFQHFQKTVYPLTWRQTNNLSIKV